MGKKLNKISSLTMAFFMLLEFMAPAISTAVSEKEPEETNRYKISYLSDGYQEDSKTYFSYLFLNLEELQKTDKDESNKKTIDLALATPEDARDIKLIVRKDFNLYDDSYSQDKAKLEKSFKEADDKLKSQGLKLDAQLVEESKDNGEVLYKIQNNFDREDYINKKQIGQDYKVYHLTRIEDFDFEKNGLQAKIKNLYPEVEKLYNFEFTVQESLDNYSVTLKGNYNVNEFINVHDSEVWSNSGVDRLNSAKIKDLGSDLNVKLNGIDSKDLSKVKLTLKPGDEVANPSSTNHTFENVRTYDSEGNIATYSVSANQIDKYYPPTYENKENYILVNYVKSNIDFKVNKIWKNYVPKATDKVTISLLKNGVEMLGNQYSVDLSQNNNWQHIFTNLDPNASYSVREKFTPSPDGRLATNISIRFDGTVEYDPSGESANVINTRNAVLTVENTPNEIKFKKIGKSSLESTTEVELSGAEFELKIKNELTYSSLSPAKTATSGTNGEFSFEGLWPGEYALFETKAPDGYAASADAVAKFTVGEDGAINNVLIGQNQDTAEVHKIVNIKGTATFKFNKVARDGSSTVTPLKDVQFELIGNPTGSDVNVRKATSDAAGNVEFRELPLNSYYYLREVASAPGYANVDNICIVHIYSLESTEDTTPPTVAEKQQGYKVRIWNTNSLTPSGNFTIHPNIAGAWAKTNGKTGTDLRYVDVSTSSELAVDTVTGATIKPKDLNNHGWLNYPDLNPT